MFGINQISWGQFSGFILFILLAWYLSVALLAFIHQKRKRSTLFEDDPFTPVDAEGLQPISISSQDYPSELIPVKLSENIALPVSFYEGSGMDDGYSIEAFSESDNQELPKILEQVQFQS
jgi:hypothetical protein